MVNGTPRSLNHSGNKPVPIAQVARWAPGPVRFEKSARRILMLNMLVSDNRYVEWVCRTQGRSKGPGPAG